MKENPPRKLGGFHGSPSWDRTNDLQIRSLSLFRLSYRTNTTICCIATVWVFMETVKTFSIRRSQNLSVWCNQFLKANQINYVLLVVSVFDSFFSSPHQDHLAHLVLVTNIFVIG